MRTPVERLGSAIKSFRKQAGLTQEQLAEAAGLTPNYIGEIERGKKVPSILVVIFIADALKIPVSELVKCVEPAARKDEVDNDTLVTVAHAMKGMNRKQQDFVMEFIVNFRNWAKG